MRVGLFITAAAVVLQLSVAPASADEAGKPKVDCNNASTQMDLNICADEDYQAADKALNEQYNRARKAMIAADASSGANGKGAEKALLAAQRAWLGYRDAECKVEGFLYEGGSMQPMIISGCMADLTRDRTKRLKALADGPEAAQ